jgi:hypothetical protein
MRKIEAVWLLASLCMHLIWLLASLWLFTSTNAIIYDHYLVTISCLVIEVLFAVTKKLFGHRRLFFLWRYTNLVIIVNSTVTNCWIWSQLTSKGWDESAACGRALMGLAGGSERVGPSGSARSSRTCFFFEFIFQCENNSSKHQKMFLEHEKYSENHKNSRKIPRDRLRHEQPK